MKVAIIGSRNFDVYDENLEDDAPNAHTYGGGKLIEALVLALNNEDYVVSGGATGADSIAEDFAKRYRVGRIIHEPAWKKYGKPAGHKRNALIVKDADIMFAFYTNRQASFASDHSGTVGCVKQANSKGIFTYEWDAKTGIWYDRGKETGIQDIKYNVILEVHRNRVIESSARRDEGG